MAKKMRHAQQKQPPQREIVIRERQEPESSDYYDQEAPEPETEEAPEEKEEPSRKKRNRLILRAAIILVLLLCAVVFWVNRENFTPENFSNWFQALITGSGAGDGYPVEITGNDVLPTHFASAEGDCLVLSDTALTRLNSTGKEVLSVRHSYSDPGLAFSNNRYLIYSRGGNNYSLVSADQGARKKESENKITAGDISSNGRYALLSQPVDYASRLEVYDGAGKLIYTYAFAEGYATALALSSDGSFGAVSTLNSSVGKLVTTVTVLDFNSEEPVAEYLSSDNVISLMNWNGNILYALGDSSAVVYEKGGEFQEHSYQGSRVTAAFCGNGRAFVSVSDYEKAGPSTLKIFEGTKEPVSIDLPDRITGIASYGNAVSVLVRNRICAFDLYSLESRGECQAGKDTRAIAMGSEGRVYLLGIRDIQNVPLVNE